MFTGTEAGKEKRLKLGEGDLKEEPQGSDSSGCKRRVNFRAIRRYTGLKCTWRVTEEQSIELREACMPQGWSNSSRLQEASWKQELGKCKTFSSCGHAPFCDGVVDGTVAGQWPVLRHSGFHLSPYTLAQNRCLCVKSSFVTVVMLALSPVLWNNRKCKENCEGWDSVQPQNGHL